MQRRAQMNGHSVEREEQIFFETTLPSMQDAATRLPDVWSGRNPEWLLQGADRELNVTREQAYCTLCALFFGALAPEWVIAYARKPPGAACTERLEPLLCMLSYLTQFAHSPQSGHIRSLSHACYSPD